MASCRDFTPGSLIFVHGRLSAGRKLTMAASQDSSSAFFRPVFASYPDAHQEFLRQACSAAAIRGDGQMSNRQVLRVWNARIVRDGYFQPIIEVYLRVHGPAQPTSGRCAHGQGDCPIRPLRRLRTGLDRPAGQVRGLEAQRKAIDDFVANRDATLVGRFTETGSGRKTNRAEPDAALTMARPNGTKARGHFPAHQGGAAGRKRTWETGHPERCGNAVGGMKGRCGA